jgi:hypothetical protein
MQTIAHNTVTVDARSQNDAKEDKDEEAWGERHFFDASNPNFQVMSAKANKEYDGVGMQRTMFLIRDARLAYPVVVDLYRITSSAEHVYDYPIHFRGQLIDTDVKYDASTTRQEALGSGSGYQHLWREGSGHVDDHVRMTWLDGNRYYTVNTATGGKSEILFARTGAGDPNFNLVAEPVMIVRRRASTELFASVIEPHGYFSEPEERSLQARGVISGVRTIASTPEGSILEVTGASGLKWTIMVNNGAPSATAEHRVLAGGQTYRWTGNYKVDGVTTR